MFCFRNGAGRPRGHLPNRQPLKRQHRVPIPPNPTLQHLQPHQPPCRPARIGHPLQRLTSDKIRSLLQLAISPQVGLKHVDRVRDLVPIERHRRLQPQRVPRPQPTRHDPELRPSLQHLAPHTRARRLVGGDVNFKAVLAGIPGARDQHVVAPRHLPPRKPIVLDRSQNPHRSACPAWLPPSASGSPAACNSRSHPSHARRPSRRSPAAPTPHPSRASRR